MTQPRLILVTGASRGIGRSAALHLAKQGDIVIAVARSKLALEKLDDEIRAAGSEAVLVPMDLKDTKGIETLGKVIGEQFGRLDGWSQMRASSARWARWRPAARAVSRKQSR
jgi:NAD(P)-dependent dehydrogenase (short-subunit alcohol dehydrogenase family)